MIVQAKYEETDDCGTSIYKPDITVIDILEKHEEFFKWLFDIKNNHQYWKIVNGQKMYCE